MDLQRAPLFLLWAVLGYLVPGSHCGSSRHSLCYSYLKVSEPMQGLPQFLSVVHLDDHPIARYDILNGKTVPLVPWMEEEEMKAPERMFRGDLEQLSELKPQTGGLHTWQVILGCELREDGSKRGFLHYGYDGMGFISFDKEIFRWVAAQPQAKKVKVTWEDNPMRSQGNKIFLEETCMEWLQRYLSYQKEALKKTEPPVGKVTGKVVNDSLEILICQAFGFYPKDIQATWMKDREVCKYETLHRNVAPNSDGTYSVWLSIEIDPKERDRFRCHMEHKGLQEPMVLALEDKTGWLIPVKIVAGLILGAGIIFLQYECWRSRKKFHRKLSTYPDLENLPPLTIPATKCLIFVEFQTGFIFGVGSLLLNLEWRSRKEFLHKNGYQGNILAPTIHEWEFLVRFVAGIILTVVNHHLNYTGWLFLLGFVTNYILGFAIEFEIFLTSRSLVEIVIFIIFRAFFFLWTYKWPIRIVFVEGYILGDVIQLMISTEWLILPGLMAGYILGDVIQLMIFSPTICPESLRRFNKCKPE